MNGLAGSGQRAAGRNARRFCAHTVHDSRWGMTLVELLIAISIIAILSALLLGVAGKAGETAREARTKQLITRLHSLVQERYESYRTRRVELMGYSDTSVHRTSLTTNGGFAFPSDIKPFGQEPRITTYTRLAGLRELVKLEMPDRWSDIVGPPGLPTDDDDDAPTIDSIQTLEFLRETPSLHSLYLRKYNELADNNFLNSETNAPNTVGALRENQNAEMLYMVVMNATADGEARGLFKETDVDDVDGDGAPEFVDGWGNPIRWLRWAPGYESDRQESFASLGPPLDEQGIVNAINADHDPLDIFRVDQPTAAEIQINASSGLVTGVRGWRLIPLIFSGGGDEVIGLYFGDNYVCHVDPYANDVAVPPDSANPHRLGAPFDREAIADNITNHDISAR